MESRYSGRNVDLSLLNKWLELFFKKKGFRTTREENTKRYKITARPTHVHEIVGVITVSIYGDSNNFVLKFESGARSDTLTKFGRLSRLFGGGVIFLQGVKSQEAEERLERKFWIYAEETINFLARPTHSSETKSS